MSQIATSIEQSRRLLAAGIDTESADTHWFGVSDLELVFGRPFLFFGQDVEYPAWSISALWQMVHELDKTYEFPSSLSADELIETLTSTICYRQEHQ